MKILFVLHNGDTIYGSGRSIVQLADSLDVDYDIVLGKSLVNKIDEDKVRESFGPRLKNIYQLWLPNFNAYFGRLKGVTIRLVEIHKYVMWKLNQKKLKRICKENGYDIIHLNTMTLCSMVNEKFPIILHVREVFEGKDWEHKYIQKKIQKAKGVIYINPSTRKMFDNDGVKEVIIQDPFDMTEVGKIDTQQVRQKYKIDSDKVVFSILGRYEDRNGTEFIIEAFQKCKSPKAVLLVVGSIPKSEKEKCKTVSEKDTRIKFVGEVEDPSPIFAISDYILRGERFFSGFSRTVYEGLYSGCRVIFPGMREEAIDSLQYEKFKENILFYKPRNIEELANLIDECTCKPVHERFFLSNKEEYVKQYIDLVTQISKVR